MTLRVAGMAGGSAIKQERGLMISRDWSASPCSAAASLTTLLVTPVQSQYLGQHSSAPCIHDQRLLIKMDDCHHSNTFSYFLMHYGIRMARCWHALMHYTDSSGPGVRGNRERKPKDWLPGCNAASLGRPRTPTIDRPKSDLHLS